MSDAPNHFSDGAFVPTGTTFKAPSLPVSQPTAGGEGKPTSNATESVPAVAPPSRAPAGDFPSDGEQLVPAGEYFGSDVKIAPEYVKGYEYMAQVFGQSGVRPAIASEGLSIIDRMMDMEGISPELPAQHAYDIQQYRNSFKAEDQAGLNYFLNAMHAKGARQSEVNAFLNLYTDAQRAKAKHAAMNAPKVQAARQTQQAANQMSLEQIRHTMKTDRKRYTRDEHMQARYRKLLSGRA